MLGDAHAQAVATRLPTLTTLAPDALQIVANALHAALPHPPPHHDQHQQPGPTAVPSTSSGTSVGTDPSAPEGEDLLAEKLALLLLLLPPSAWPQGAWRDREQQQQWDALLDLSGHSIVAAEVRDAAHALPTTLPCQCRLLCAGCRQCPRAPARPKCCLQPVMPWPLVASLA